MVFKLPPPPQSNDLRSSPWQDWFYKLGDSLTRAASIAWNALDFTGSNLTDLETRNHADLQNINTASYTHLTSIQATDLTDGGETALHKHIHNNLDSLQGGIAGEYYHLTAAQIEEFGRPVVPPVFFAEDAGEAEPIIVPGPKGDTGAQGAQGVPGIQGIQGLAGPAVWLVADDGEDGMMGPPGQTGPAGSGGSSIAAWVLPFAAAHG